MTTMLYRDSDPVWHLALVAFFLGVFGAVLVCGAWDLAKLLIRELIKWRRGESLRLRGGHR